MQSAGTFLVTLTLSILAGCAMPGRSFTGPLPPPTHDDTTLAARLKSDVTYLAGTLGNRDTDHPAPLKAAATFIEQRFRSAGYAVDYQPYAVDGQTVYNVIAELPGTSDEIVVVGAHYDSVKGAPGANDNASGVAALLALADRLVESQPQRTLRLIAFVNEEPPYFQTDQMGSLVYARAAKARGDKITAMISLETIGCYSDEPHSQHYPAPFNLVYPSEGNFIAFVGNLGSAGLVKHIVNRFRNDVRFPSEGAAVLGSIEGVGWSDHWSFWQCGYPAVMVTDTAPFRYRWYHTAQDTPDKIEYDRTARVVNGIELVVRDLLARP